MQPKSGETPYAHLKMRIDAESRLAGTSTVNLPNASVAEKVLHELQVHQIELEMQNEALQQTHLALEESRDRYLDLFEFAPIGYFTLTTTGLIAEVNFVGAQLLGENRGTILLKPFVKYVAPDFSDQFHLDLAQLIRDEVPQSYEIQIEHEDETRIFAHVDAICVKKSDGSRQCRMTLSDITKLKQAEDSLRIMATTFESQEGIIVTDVNNKIVRVNQAFSRITGYSAAEVLGENASIISSFEHDAAFFKSIFEIIARDQHWQGEMWNQRKNTEIFPCLMTITAVVDNQGRTTNFVGSFLDISLQKIAEKTLQNARELLEQKAIETATELASAKGDSEEVNTALRVLMRMHTSENAETKSLFNEEIKQKVLPFLQMLKNDNQDSNQNDSKQLDLITMLERNLQLLISSFGNPSTVSSLYRSLTPKEIQVATMVKDGLSSKEIASTLLISEETIGIHRKNIRKKLGLGNNGENLRSYLITTKE